MKTIKKFLSAFLVCALLFCSVCCLSGCSKVYQKTFFALDTVINIKLNNGGSQELLDELQTEIQRLDGIFDRFSGELSKINSQGGGSARYELTDAIEAALELCYATNGAFDITVGGVSSLWDFKNGAVPSQTDINEALKKVDYRLVTVQDGVISLNGATVDLGGFAKGYICDLAVKFLEQNGVTEAILDLGGNIYVIGDKHGSGYNIGIANPNGGDPVCTVKLSSTSAVTSGIYQRNFEADGVFYHHILDPKTGKPANNELASVTVICESAARADALSTAMMVMGKTEACELAKKENVRVIFIDKNGELTDVNGKDL